LSDSSVLLTYTDRNPPFGIRALISNDECKSWNMAKELILTADSTTWDCGYPSSVELQNAGLYTAYYANDSMGVFMHGKRYPVGIHSAGIKFSRDIFK